ncbi:hypothetical protein JW905_03920 [bacterium]|nr:hypothetical protein [candidate division CSSED10-310 bacterium]
MTIRRMLATSLGILLLVPVLATVFNYNRELAAILAIERLLFAGTALLTLLAGAVATFTTGRFSATLRAIMAILVPPLFCLAAGVKLPLVTAMILTMVILINHLPPVFLRRLTQTRGREVASALLVLAGYPFLLASCPVIIGHVAGHLIGGPKWAARLKTIARLALLAVILPGMAAVAAFYNPSTPESPGSHCIARGNYFDLEIDPATCRLFACNIGRDRIEAFDLRDLRLPPLRKHFPCTTVQYIAHDPEARRLFLYDIDPGRIFTIDSNTLKIIDVRELGPVYSEGSAMPVYDPSSGLVYISVEVGEIAVLDLVTHQVTKRFPGLGNRNLDQEIDVTDRRLFLSYPFGNRHIAVIDLDTLTELPSIPLPQYGSQIALDPRTDLLYVPLSRSPRLLVINWRTGRIEAERRIDRWVRTIQLDLHNRLIFTISFVTSTIRAIDLDDGSCKGSWQTGRWPRRLALDETRGKAYVATKMEGLWEIDYRGLLASGGLEAPGAVGAHSITGALP